MGVVFNAVPYDNEVKDYFLFADTPLTFKTWLYFVCEHLVLIMLAYVIAAEAKKYTLPCKVFFWIQVGNLADYLLTYNTNWIGFINFNIVSIVIFATSILYEYGRGSD
jgi:nicotinamide riboside transporter PnuC